MNKRQKAQGDMLILAEEFADGRKADFQNDPPKKGDAKFATTLQTLEGAIKDLGGKAAIQSGRAFNQQTEDIRLTREEVEEVLRSINRDVAAIAAERKQPGLMDRFRMPYGSGDTELRNKLRAFADGIEELDLAAALDELAQEETPTSLRKIADNFEGDEGDQGGALGKQVGATKVIPQILTRGMTAVKALNSIFSNRYKGDAELLGAWKTASRVRRTDGGSGKGDADTPKPGPNP